MSQCMPSQMTSNLREPEQVDVVQPRRGSILKCCDDLLVELFLAHALHVVAPVLSVRE
jgi:hypothetical protein